MLTSDRLREVLDYDPATGVFRWKVTLAIKGSKGVAGSVAGSPRGPGDYWVIGIDGKSYRRHRLAWFYMTGEWPTGNLDHINRTPGDDRYENLRNATRSQNAMNSGLFSHNTSGVKGVCWSNSISKWIAYIKINQRHRTIGEFHVFEDAVAARRSVEKSEFGAFSPPT